MRAALGKHRFCLKEVGSAGKTREFVLAGCGRISLGVDVVFG